jgi:transmembrane sensor
MLSSGADGRDVTLSDGSKLRMAPASEVRIEFRRTERLAEVRKGRVRLTVARESRPFRIIAGASSTEMSAGSFEATVVDGHGAVTPVSDAGNAILSGERTAAATSDPPAAQQKIEFNSEPLGQAIQRINQAGAGRPIELDPALSDLRVTGLFQRGDSEAIARSLAVAFGLKLTSTPSGALLLSREK